MLATHVRMSTGQTRSDGAPSRVTKLIHQRLPTDARIGLWAGRESGEINCGCGNKLGWANRDQVGQLQWHMFACSLPEETNVRRRWLYAVRRGIAAHIKDVAIARIVVRCWTHTNVGGQIEAAEQDQKKRWHAPSMRWRGGAWWFDDVIPRTHDASGFDSDDDDADAERVTGSTASIATRDQYDVGVQVRSPRSSSSGYSDPARAIGVVMRRAWARAWVVWGDTTERQPRTCE